MATSRQRIKRHIQQQQPTQIPDARAGATTVPSFPMKAFGRDTPTYHAFLNASKLIMRQMAATE